MAEQEQSLITDEVKALIGAEAPPSTMWGTISADSVRRFIQAIMDNDPVYWDEEYAEQTKYGGGRVPAAVPRLRITTAAWNSGTTRCPEGRSRLGRDRWWRW